MLLEDVTFLLLLASGIFFVGLPIAKLIKTAIPVKRNSLTEAKERLEQVRIEVETAKLNKEAEHLIETLYDEALEDTQLTHKENETK